MSFRINREQFIPPLTSTETKGTKTNSKDFQKILQDSLGKKEDKIKISAHAQQRISERHINLNDKDLNRLNQAMDTLEKKGAKESLMIYKDMAFIASVKNRTIITAMQNKEMDLVTNIDSAIVVK